MTSERGIPLDRRDEAWGRLVLAAQKCEKCPLAPGRKNVVFGDGDRSTRLLFIGEAPGAEEDEQGIPFVGKAGQLLTRILEAAGIDRKGIYITNVVKCRPPGNRVPSIEEMHACEDILKGQVALINPSIIVCLGATPTKWILKTGPGESISKIRGKWFDWKGIRVMPMFHPSFLLRNQSKKKGSPRELTWIDIQEVRDRWLECR
ncbi:MAG TPA: uracil-DNA glycosylase [Synergistaceae bacterium]|jgi:DNA polymerase|nr:uracil-DNA glycosylase [Synergistaceae bacterium]